MTITNSEAAGLSAEMLPPVTSPFTRFAAFPEKAGLYDPSDEHENCGMAAVATLRGEPGHDIVDQALHALRRVEHRGAVGSDIGTGDGAGILTQIPDELFRAVCGFRLPAQGHYAAGTAFLPQDATERAQMVDAFDQLAASQGLQVLGWRDVPVNDELIGGRAKAAMPHFTQVFLTLAAEDSFDYQESAPGTLDQRAWRLRKRAQVRTGIYFASLSSTTITYKGMLTTAQLEPFYSDLSDPRYKTALGIVHSRFSTNTFPSWPLAQPLRHIAHNGEINTVRGNRNWMRARQSTMAGEVLGDDPEYLYPICTPAASDSTSLDEVAELLMLSGRPLAQTMRMMIPEAWEIHESMDPALRAFFEYHSMLMEAWDGPAALAFTDGNQLGAVLDRNGLRPARYWVTDEGLVILASEVGVVDVEPATVVRKGRVAPGMMFLVDTGAGRIIEDEEITAELAAQNPWQQWVEENLIQLQDLPDRLNVRHPTDSVRLRQQTFGYTHEELRKLIGPMARTGAEPLGAMGTDTPIAVLADRPRLLFDYFVQAFAQVTNPPLDSIREELVTSLGVHIGPKGNLLTLGKVTAKQIHLDFPVITNDQLAKISNIRNDDGVKETLRIRGLFRAGSTEDQLRQRIRDLCEQVSAAAHRGVAHIVISDRDSSAQWVPIPSLLLLSAVHHHLLKSANRTKVSLIVEAGDVREVHHLACLIGYGASAVNPYLAIESAEDLVARGELTGLTREQAIQNLISALGRGLLKIMSKMGISTVASYCAAQTFEAVGLAQHVVDQYFSGTPSPLGGIGLDVIAAEASARHRQAYPEDGNDLGRGAELEIGGEYQWRREGPPHLFNPETIFKLQHSSQTRRYDIFKQYTKAIDDQSKQLMTLRGLFKLTGTRDPVPISEVEPVSEIVKRFSTGAMSYGSISQEAHEVLAIAMNRLGARSNTGEGGEHPSRLADPARRSAVKQIASGRFGVTSQYLTHADDLQIKLAQGAKPGEGGQLMGAKVYPWIAETRHSTAGVSLVSPPPHHDIYSIEDLKQLIYDLKRANTAARVHVKLVSLRGVGTVAAGAVKAAADVVLISGHDGGTGASPLNSLKHAGTPWEVGLAETQQTLMLNGLRQRVTVQVDGQLKTGRDVVIAALLGAEEYGFATSALVVSGCVMMRVCHLDTCPVGVATQNPVLRERFTGQADHVVNFFEFIAQEVREHLAELGFRSLDEAIGQINSLSMDEARKHWKSHGLDLGAVLGSWDPTNPDTAAMLRRSQDQDHQLDKHFDVGLIDQAQPAIRHRTPVRTAARVTNTDRAVGTMLGHELTKTLGLETLADDTIELDLTGEAGQSLGAFLPAGITIRLAGDTNDYAGKGLSGGRLIIHPDPDAVLIPEENVVAGNVIGYGATSGQMFINGQVGERFLVRNSGASAVVEGIGDHGCEYMTGGQALILGAVGRNFGAGMSGGTAYVLDLDEAMLNAQAAAADVLLQEPDQEDRKIVLDLLHRHAEETGSPLARRLLAQPEVTLTRITKILPKNYDAVLKARSQALEEGLDVDGDAAWQKILEVTGG